MFKYIILLSALIIAFSSAWFSITGISQLFMGEYTAAMIMAGALELGKLVAVSFVYRYWSELRGLLKYYMVVATIIISIITSLGIFAFLSAAYAETAVDYRSQMIAVQTIDLQRQSVEDLLASQNIRLDQLRDIRSQQEARLGGLVVTSETLQRMDTLVARGTTVDLRAFNSQNEAIQQTDQQIQDGQVEATRLSIQRDSLELERATKQIEVTSGSKIGTFAYVADTLGVDLDDLINWFVFIIVVVFDPLAISLLIGYNVIVMVERRKIRQEEVIHGGEEVGPTLEDPMEEPEPLSETPGDDLTDLGDGDHWVSVASHKEASTSTQPYYTKVDYDWENDIKWKTDASAIRYKSRIDEGTR